MTMLVEAPELIESVLSEINRLQGLDDLEIITRKSDCELFLGSGALKLEELDQETCEVLGRFNSVNSDLVPQYQRASDLFRGTWSEAYPSQSEADAAFCSFLSGEGLSSVQIDMALRASGLFRPKWERTDYRHRTIGLAMAQKSEGTSATPTKQHSSWLVEMNEQFAVVRVGATVHIMDFKTPSVSKNGVKLKPQLLEVAAFKQLQAGQNIADEKSGKTVKKADAWLNHPERRQYQGVNYAPGTQLTVNVLNLWRGFQVNQKVGNVNLWLDLLGSLVTDQQLRQWILLWLAWRIQNLDQIPGTVPIFKGRKGTGKNSLFDPIISIFGDHAMVADDPELIVGRFNGHLIDKSFVVLDEAVYAGDRKQADKLKARITAKTISYEFKGMTPINGENRCAYVMLTNHEHVWQATTDERRVVVVEVGDSLQGDHVFWGKYHEWVESDGPSALLHYLKSLDITGFNPRAIPICASLETQIELTAMSEPVAAWWHQILCDGEVRWFESGNEIRVQFAPTVATHVNGTGLRLSYEQSVASKVRHAPAWSVVGKKIRKWCDPHVIGEVKRSTPQGARVRDLIMPPLNDMQSAFTAHTGVKIS